MIKQGKTFSRIVISTLIGVSTIMMTMYGIINYYREYRIHFERIENELNNISAQLSESIVGPIWELNIAGINSLIESNMKNKNVYGITIKLKNDSMSFGRMRDMNWNSIVTDKDIPTHGLIYKRSRITFEKHDLGELTVLMSPRFIKVDLNKSIISTALGVLALNISLVIILFLILKRAMIDPLKSIENYAISMSTSKENNINSMEAESFVKELDNLKQAIVRMANGMYESKRRLAEIIEFLPVATFVIDMEGKVVAWNKATEKMTDVLAEEMIGRDNYEYSMPFYGERRPILVDMVLMARDEQEKLLRKKYVSVKREGHLLAGEAMVSLGKGKDRFLSGWAHPLYNSDGEIIGAIQNISDSTDKKRAEDMRIAKNVAEEANLAKSVFLANMSHEIRTPLNAILGFSQILSDDQNLSFQQRDQLATINRSGEYLLGLINDILEISKIEAGRMVLNPIDFDLEAMIRDLELMLKVKTEAKQLILSMEVAKDTPRFIRGDEAKLRQIYTNLVGNSIKFTSEGSISLWVSCMKDQDKGLQLITEVKDTGVGIAEEEQSSLFECFEQTSSGISSGGGTGLGLAISRQYAILMGGDITVESEVGKGSLFRVVVSFEVGDEKGIKTMQKQKETGIRIGEDQNRILIVDDNAVNRKVLKFMLEKVGFITEEAFNGVSAVEMFVDWQPHLVLMDIRMPVMDGYEATRRIKAMEGGAKVPIVAITASVFDDEREEVIAVGVDGFIAKPFRENELFHVIGSLLNIEYTYADEEIENGLAENTVSDLLPEAIAALPQDLNTELRKVVESADLDDMLELIGRIENHDKKTADILKGMAQRYEYESLLNILT